MKRVSPARRAARRSAGPLLSRRGVIGLGTLAAVLLAGGTAAQEPRSLSLHLRDPANSPAHQGAARAAALLRTLSDGRLQLAVAPGRGRGTFDGLLSGLDAGEIDITLFPASALGPWVARAAILETPLVARDYTHLLAILDSAWGQALRDELRTRHGWRVLDSWYDRTRHMTARRPLRALTDFQDLRLRVPSTPAMLAFAAALGAVPDTTALFEARDALAGGKIDGLEGTLDAVEALALYEVQGHLALTGHLVQDQLVLISERAWQALSAAERRLVRIAILAGGGANNAAAVAREATLIEALTAKGMAVTRPDPAALRAAMMPVYDALEAEFGTGAVSALLTIE